MKTINNVLITGVAGFIGSNLLDYLLLKTNWRITGIDNLTTGTKTNISGHLGNSRFKFQEVPIVQLKSLREYDCIFHLAALPRIQPSFEFVTEHIDANLTSSMYLIETMVRESHFPKFVFSSSSAIYGTPSIIPTPEHEKVDCLSPYAFQKYEVEKYLELLATRYPINYVNLRYFNPYGPRSFNPDNKFNAYSSVVGIFLYSYHNKKELLITGDGSQRRDFVHVADLAKANFLAAIHPDRLNTAINIGNGSTMSILELAKAVSSNYRFVPKRQGESEITFADVSKAKKLLDWQPERNILDYIKGEL
jgi:UDP-glucose 4-epimerase